MTTNNGHGKDTGVSSELRVRLCPKRAWCIENENHEGPCVEVPRQPYDMSDRSQRPEWDRKTRDPLGVAREPQAEEGTEQVTDPKDEYRRRYLAACHKMQTGVAILMEEPVAGQSQETDPKHIRVGINSALRDGSSLARLLMAKGLISEEEYLRAICEGMEEEAADYEQMLKRRFGAKVTLG